MSVCDFCNAPQPRWLFPCRDFTVHTATEGPDGPEGVTSHQMEGAWLACDPCRPLVEAQDWRGVAFRLGQHDPAARQNLDRDTVAEVGNVMAGLWSRFQANRTGPPSRVEE